VPTKRPRGRKLVWESLSAVVGDRIAEGLFRVLFVSGVGFAGSDVQSRSRRFVGSVRKESVVCS
jgi:hypothetical protein